MHFSEESDGPCYLSNSTSKRRKIIKKVKPQDLINKLAAEALLSEQVFSIPLILKQILSYLPKRQLLCTSLVNKTWNFISREILRSEENSLSNLNIYTCEKLTFISRALEWSENLPYNGVSITMLSYECQCAQRNDLTECAKYLLENVNIKYLSIQYERGKACILMYFIREILSNRAKSLEGLTLKGVPSGANSFSEIFGLNVEGRGLPNLRVLRFPSMYSECAFLNVHLLKQIPKNLMKELVQASPKLQKLYGTCSTDCLEFLFPHKNTILEDLIFQPLVDPLDSVLKLALEEPKLKRIRFSTRISSDNGPRFEELPTSQVDKVAQILTLLLRSSQDTLSTFSADNLDLLLMTHQWKVPVLKNVRELNLTQVISYIYDVEGYLTLRKLEWEKYLPNLTRVWVTDSYFITDNYTRDFYINAEIRQSPVNYSCGTVSTIVIEATCYLREEEVDLTTLRTLFPNARKLIVDYNTRFYPIFAHILNGWHDLETLVIKFRRVESIYFNLDDYFLGVSKVEVIYMSRHINQLDTLEIVPQNPCLLNFPKLTKLEIHLKHDGYLCSEEILPTNSMFISHLTPLCAFSRFPNIFVEIHRRVCCRKNSCHLALNHLKSFVSLVNRKDSDF